MELVMFYEVRVLDPKGKLKKVVSSQELSKRYWNAFHESANSKETLKLEKAKKKVKQPFDLPDVYRSEN